VNCPSSAGTKERASAAASKDRRGLTRRLGWAVGYETRDWTAGERTRRSGGRELAGSEWAISRAVVWRSSRGMSHTSVLHQHLDLRASGPRGHGRAAYVAPGPAASPGSERRARARRAWDAPRVQGCCADRRSRARGWRRRGAGGWGRGLDPGRWGRGGRCVGGCCG